MRTAVIMVGPDARRGAVRRQPPLLARAGPAGRRTGRVLSPCSADHEVRGGGPSGPPPIHHPAGPVDAEDVDDHGAPAHRPARPPAPASRRGRPGATPAAWLRLQRLQARVGPGDSAARARRPRRPRGTGRPGTPCRPATGPSAGPGVPRRAWRAWRSRRPPSGAPRGGGAGTSAPRPAKSPMSSSAPSGRPCSRHATCSDVEPVQAATWVRPTARGDVHAPADRCRSTPSTSRGPRPRSCRGSTGRRGCRAGGFQVERAISSPWSHRDGDLDVAVAAVVRPRRPADLPRIIARGTGLIAGSPTSSGSPGRVTVPTPGPARKTTPAPAGGRAAPSTGRARRG